jgi:Nif-specific regulatory protein
LQEKEFERVGSQTPIHSDVRVITATSRDLEQMIEQGRFRSDLYYRLNVFPIYVPPLRERKADILLLADHFVEKYAKQNHKAVRRISTAAIDLLTGYHWPGNVRELENCIERAVLPCLDKAIKAQHLPPTLQKEAAKISSADGTLKTAIAGLENEMVVAELKACGGNRSATARNLGLTERQIGLRIKRFGIDSKRFRHRD